MEKKVTYKDTTYVLTDAEIKEGDFVLWRVNDGMIKREVFKYKNTPNLFVILEHNDDHKVSRNFMKKIKAEIKHHTTTPHGG